MESQQIVGKTEFIIEQYENKNCIVRDEKKCYIPMFKYHQKEGTEHWCFALPVQSMYLMTIQDAKQNIIKSIQSDKDHDWTADYKIAEIKNPKEPVKDKTAKVKNVGLDHKTGEIIIRIDALGTIYVPKLGNYHSLTMLYNSAPLIEGIELLMKYGSIAVQAIKKGINDTN